MPGQLTKALLQNKRVLKIKGKRYSSVAGDLSAMHKALESIPSTEKEKRADEMDKLNHLQAHSWKESLEASRDLAFGMVLFVQSKMAATEVGQTVEITVYFKVGVRL